MAEPELAEPTATGVPYEEVSFPSDGTRCDAWHFRATSADLTTEAGRPVVVMAHGLAGTKDSGLQPFAEALAAAGLDVLAFDYRGFGASDGTPRQRVSIAGQVQDYRAAMQAARRLDGVDAGRLVLWGVSLAGGHVLAAAVNRSDVAAVVSLTPLVSGMAAARLALRQHHPSQLLKSSAAGLRGRLADRTGRGQVLIPVVARPGETGALTLPGALEAYQSIAGPTWRNEIDATVSLELGNMRAARHAKQLGAPLLVQIADFDRSAPPYAAAKAAFAGRAEVRHYPCDHFDVWPGKEWFEPAVNHQVAFLTRHLTAR